MISSGVALVALQQLFARPVRAHEDMVDLRRMLELLLIKDQSADAGLASIQDHVGKRVGILGYGSIGRQGKFYPYFCPARVRCLPR